MAALPRPVGFTQMDEGTIRRVFNRLDSDGNGILDLDEFKAGLKRVGLPCVDRDARHLFLATHPKDEPVVDFDGFKQFVAEREHYLFTIFGGIDTNHDGYIDAGELQAAVTAFNPEVVDLDYHRILKRLDRSRDALVSFDEFRHALLLLPNLHSATVLDFWAYSALDVTEDSTSTRRQRTFVAGSISAMVARTAVAPLDRVRVMMQAYDVHPPTIAGEFRAIYAEGGLPAFWRGNLANVLKVAPETGVRYLMSDVARYGLAANPTNPTTSEKLVIGAIAGVVAHSSIYPLETIRTRMAIARTGVYRGVLDCVGKIRAQQGMRGLYNGWLPSAIGVVPHGAVQYMVYQTFFELYAKAYPDCNPSWLALIGSASFASCCAQLVAYPYTLVRTRMQSQGAPGMATFRGMVHCAVDTVRQFGARGLYDGLAANLLKTVPSVAIQFALYHELIQKL